MQQAGMGIRLCDVTMEEFAAIRLYRTAAAEYQEQKNKPSPLQIQDEARRAPR